MEVEIHEARKTFEINLFAVITMCQTFLPLLIKAKGTIVQIGSVAGVCLILDEKCLYPITTG
jgi:1-acylglycerone phosphate reductase